jgi:hypothetical protein
MAKQQHKVGRPERSKTSYANEIQRLKRHERELEKEKLFINLTLERYIDKVMSFELAPLPKRIKKAIRGKI